MVYTIEFISVNDSYILAFESEEEKLKVFMSSKFINILKLLSSGNEASQDDVYLMSQGQVNGIKNNAQFLGFKNDRGVIPLCYDFPCKFIKIK